MSNEFYEIQNLEDNFSLLLTETSSQVERSFTFIETFSQDLYEKVVQRDDYIDNLKLTIENQCFDSLRKLTSKNKEEMSQIRARQIICVNLEKIADFCVNICKQVEFIHDKDFWLQFSFQPMCRMIEENLKQIEATLSEKSVAKAMIICRSECELDDLFKENFDQIMLFLRTGEQVDTCVTTLFIFRYLERMGDSLLNIGEAILLAILGDKIKIRQFEAMQQSLDQSGMEIPPEKLEVNSFLGTRSGCNISRLANEVNQGLSDERREGLFKSGNPEKIEREKDNIEEWSRIKPGLVPKIFSFQKEPDRSSMLVEFLSGQTLEATIVSCSWLEIDQIMNELKANIVEIWKKTAIRKPTPTNYMDQLLKRTEAIRTIHPDIMSDGQIIGGVEIPSAETLVKNCRHWESRTPAPFSVFGHGDFNVNNVLYDFEKQALHYIDLYRSHRADYLEDVAVFLVSNFRLPIFDRETRKKINKTIISFYDFAHDFAQKNKDQTFALRLALALARSFMTSTRFEQKRKFSREMGLRSTYLLERIDRHLSSNGSPVDFSFPRSILILP
ncbi:MAG: PhoU domain-containing protein [Pseudomonadota bacterium]|nr:PhoU domain-containing protein [Pseudomonadota bacterium]